MLQDGVGTLPAGQKLAGHVEYPPEILIPWVEFSQLGQLIIGPPLLALGGKQVVPDNWPNALDSLLHLPPELNDGAQGRWLLFPDFPTPCRGV